MLTTKLRHFISKKTGALLLITAVTAGALAAGANIPQAAAAEITTVTAKISPEVAVVIDGVSRTFYDVSGKEVHPVAYNGTNYLPVRAIGELMGKNVNWDQSTKTISLTSPRTAASVKGSPDNDASAKNISAELRPDFTVIVDGTKRTFKDEQGNIVYPLLNDGTTYLPVRAIGELMGKNVSWNSASKTVILSSSGSLVTDADSFNQGSHDNSGSPASDGSSNSANAGNSNAPSSGQNSADNVISSETAKAKALAHAGLKANQVTFIRSNLEWDDGRRIYDVEFYTGDGREYDYEIDAYTGGILDFDYDAEAYTPSANQNTSSYIGEAKARSIALARVQGASDRNVTKLKLDYDDGRWQYEGEIVYGYYEYEFEIDAYTGTILSWERDRD